jgi:dihydrodipicolinate synthase/N-acetylneuraminate lyase
MSGRSLTLVSTQWEGVFATVTTPFAEDESLDLEALEARLVQLVDSGVGGVVVLGPLGEGESLAPWERDAVVRRSVRAVGGRVPVLVAVAEPTTRGACHFAVECERAGADGLLIMPSPQYLGDERETRLHHRSVAAAVELGVLELGDGFGEGDEHALQAALLGARGHLSAVANVCPEAAVERWRLAVARRFDEAVEIHRALEPLRRAVSGGKAVQALKLAQTLAGLGTETARAPRLPLTGAERDRIAQLVQRVPPALRQLAVDGAPAGT